MAQTIRTILEDLLTAEMPEPACEQLCVPPRTTYQAALVKGMLERGLRGDAAAFSAIAAISDPLIDDSEEIDDLSLALLAYEDVMKLELEQKSQSAEASKSVE